MVAVFPLLKDPVIVPSEPMLKFCRVPLLVPSCWIDAVLFGPANCVRSPTPALATCHAKVSWLAPSAKTVWGVGGVVTGGTGGTVMLGLVRDAVPPVGVMLWRVPSPLKMRVPVATLTGAVAPVMSAAGIVAP